MPFVYTIDDILSEQQEFTHFVKLLITDCSLRDPTCSMPFMQSSKCYQAQFTQKITDNGRILAAKYVEINITEVDLDIINRQYDFDSHICSEVYVAAKDYLPRWFTG